MKKCTRCDSLLVWDRTYCPMCGAMTVETPDIPRVREVHDKEKEQPTPSAAAAAASVAASESLRAEDDHVPPIETDASAAKEEAHHEHADLPPRPASPIPGLEYLDEEDEEPAKEQPAAAAPVAPPASAPLEPLEPLEPLSISTDAFSGIQKGSASGGAMFERTGTGSGEIPVSQTPKEQPSSNEGGEFLKMFPDAKPE